MVFDALAAAMLVMLTQPCLGAQLWPWLKPLQWRLVCPLVLVLALVPAQRYSCCWLRR